MRGWGKHLRRETKVAADSSVGFSEGGAELFDKMGGLLERPAME